MISRCPDSTAASTAISVASGSNGTSKVTSITGRLPETCGMSALVRVRRVPSTRYSGRSFQLFVLSRMCARGAAPELRHDEERPAHHEHEEEERELDPDEHGERDQDRGEQDRRPEHEPAVAAHAAHEHVVVGRPGSATCPTSCRTSSQLQRSPYGDLGRGAAVARDRDQRRAHAAIVARRSRGTVSPRGNSTSDALGIVRCTVVGSRAGGIRAAAVPAPRRRLIVATAVVQEQQLLKTLRWYDGFVIALANPGFLLGSLGLLRRRPRRLGRRAPLGHLRRRRGLHQHDLLRARDHVPGEVRRPRALRARGVAQVHDARRADRDVRLLDRLVGRPLRQRPLHRLDHPEHVVLGRAGRQLPRAATGYFSMFGLDPGRPAGG